MERFLRTLSIRRKKRPKTPESNGGSHPITWQEDERKVREGSCSFQVKYLGSVEVFESRGIQICEDAIKRLKSQSKRKYQRAILYVSGDALRVVDELSKGLLVDQTIEKVSFCAPDRYHTKGFAYICRDGTTRRWLCHGFLAVKETGERLSHAVGCAFAICLEKKQKREREAVTVQFNEDRTSFTRFGSFRQASLAERLQDPQAVIPAPSSAAAAPSTSTTAPKSAAVNSEVAESSKSDANGGNKPLPPGAIQRPHASSDLLERQASFRGFSKLQELVSPFKRGVSLRLGELPSTRERQAHDFGELHGNSTSQGDTAPNANSTSTSTSANRTKAPEIASMGLSNSAFATPSQAPNGVNPSATLWQTPTIVEEDEPPLAAPANDPFAAAPFKPTARISASQTAAPVAMPMQMHHSLTSGSIASAATPTASASPSVASGLSTPARPIGGFTLLPSSSSMTPLGVTPMGVTSVGNNLVMTPMVMTPYGVMTPVNAAMMTTGGTIVMVTPTPMSVSAAPRPVTMTGLTSVAQFTESSVPPSASKAQLGASGAPTSPTSGSNLDPFDVAWAEKQTTRARLNNPFASINAGSVATAAVDADVKSNSQLTEAFKVSL